MQQATLTPQNAFPLVGSLENEQAIRAVAITLINDDAAGLLHCCTHDDERLVCRHLLRVLEHYPESTREEIGRVKEIALLHWGSPIMSCIDYLASAMRTPAIAESAIRSAGNALFQAAELADPPLGKETRELFRRTMAQVITPLTAEELSI